MDEKGGIFSLSFILHHGISGSLRKFLLSAAHIRTVLHPGKD